MTVRDDEPKTYRCRATADGHRCDYRGTRDELAAHADEVGHARCIIDGRTLNEHERQCCTECVQRVRDDLDAVAVAYAHLHRRVTETAYHGGRLPGGDALVMLADGSTQGGGPDEWLTDPVPVLAILEANERDWRHEFGHGPAANLATIASCLAYLRTWHALAARTHPGFDDYAGEVRELRSRLEHVVGMADDPEQAAPCFICGGTLVRVFTDKGLSDDRTCRRCSAVYEPKDYWFAMRVRTQQEGWVPAEEAAEKTDRPIATVKAWVQAGHVPVACNWFTRRTVLEMSAVQERSDVTPRVTRRSA